MNTYKITTQGIEAMAQLLTEAGEGKTELRALTAATPQELGVMLGGAVALLVAARAADDDPATAPQRWAEALMAAHAGNTAGGGE